ncbi:uncharacterized protein LOC143573735 [Bidens hawaiensis]|uniref:uncharacterized protein LOC143573735 n=1 Tax=Bidens hawaiensis TaxID=980011 RepID=UPI00404B38E7
MFRIVRFQALVRGRNIRNTCDLKVMCSVGVSTPMQILKLSSNGFARKILASSPTPMPLHFHYNSTEANSITSWLERWSTSRCWQLLPKPKSNHLSKPMKPHGRRSSVTNVEMIASEFDKSIRSVRKVSSLESINCIEENPELILERIKRNLRKVSSSILHNTNDSTVQNMISEPEKLKANEAETVIIKKTEEKDENAKERRKPRRVVCAPAKQELIENDESLPVKRLVPGYMAATVSAKAKLKGQDGYESFNTLTRRYSLPLMTDISCPVSPMAKTNGKLKNDRSLQLSRDGNGNGA